MQSILLRCILHFRQNEVSLGKYDVKVLNSNFLGKTRVLWTDLVLTIILIGGLLTVFVMGTVDSGGMSAVVQKAKDQDHFQQDSFSFTPTHQVSTLD